MVSPAFDEMEGRVSGDMGDIKWEVGSGVKLLFREPNNEDRRDEVLPDRLESAIEDAFVSVQSSSPGLSEIYFLEVLDDDSRSRLLR